MVASNDIQTGTATGPRTERYRRAERAFWETYGLAPTERVVTVGSPPVRLRVQELGSGEPVLFVNGTGGPGAYFAPLLAELPGLRCLVLDRPGWGLSAPVDFSGRPTGRWPRSCCARPSTRSVSIGRASWAAP
jgi:hypothetical protein